MKYRIINRICLLFFCAAYCQTAFSLDLDYTESFNTGDVLTAQKLNTTLNEIQTAVNSKYDIWVGEQATVSFEIIKESQPVVYVVPDGMYAVLNNVYMTNIVTDPISTSPTVSVSSDLDQQDANVYALYDQDGMNVVGYEGSVYDRIYATGGNAIIIQLSDGNVASDIEAPVIYYIALLSQEQFDARPRYFQIDTSAQVVTTDYTVPFVVPAGYSGSIGTNCNPWGGLKPLIKDDKGIYYGVGGYTSLNFPEATPIIIENPNNGCIGTLNINVSLFLTP